MPQIDLEEQKRWVEAVRDLLNRVEGWSRQQGWGAQRKAITLSEDKLGAYEVSVLTVETPAGKIIVEPVARWSSPGDGRVDVYSWPSLNRLMLVRKGADWTLLTESGVRWPQPWGQATFFELATNLNAAA